MNNCTGFTAICTLLIFFQLHYGACMECYTCTSAATLCECKATTQCPNANDICFSEHTVTATGKQYTLGCRDATVCPISHQTGGGSGTIVGRSTPSNCSQCCDTDNCNRKLCQDQDPSCTDTGDFDCVTIGSTVNYCADARHAKRYCKYFCGLCTLRDGGWSAWTSWSACDVTCNNGTQSRLRTCTNPEPKDCGDKCEGAANEQQTCVKPLCPVHGGWSVWSSWGTCSVSCDIGLERRDRSCSQPYPARNGDHCFGSSRDERLCFMAGCHDGGWSDWGQWSQCSRTCGDGVRSRSHLCNNPKPSLTGSYCVGDPFQTDTCTTRSCPAKLSAFTATNPIYSGGRMVFNVTKINEGHDYNPSNGIFTCEYPGLYYFTVDLTKKRGSSPKADAVGAFILKNGISIIYIIIDPTDDATDNGSYGTTGSVIMHLVKGDTVCVFYYHASYTVESWSLFSGYLLHPDA